LPSLLTKQFSYHSAMAFANSFLADSIYLYIGRPTDWAVPGTPEASTDIHTDHISIWNNMAGASRVTRNSVAVGIKRVNWASGIVYEKYKDNITTLGEGNGFYVLAGPSDRCVYKCLDNNYDAPSLYKPIHKNQLPVKEADGYVWKYMYEISIADYTKFATADYLPVYNQKGTSAGPGTILNIPLMANSSSGIGSDYRGSGFSNGTIGIGLHATANIATTVTEESNQLVLRSDQGGLSEVDNFYNNCSIMLTSGASQGKIFDIVDYVGSTKTVSLSSGVSRVAVGDTFTIGPKITVDGDGAGLTAIGNVNQYGNVISISVGTIGSNYSNVRSIAIEGDFAAAPDGSDASANIYIPPFGGHGNRLIEELNGKFVIVSADLPRAGSSVDGDGYFVGYGQDYRHVGLLRNPLTVDSVLARGGSYDLRTHLYFDSNDVGYPDILAKFLVDSTLTNSNTGATGVVWNHPDTLTGSRHLTLVNVMANSGLTFSNGQYVSAAGIGKISSANLDQFLYKGIPPLSSVLPGQLAKYSGEIIYHEDRTLVYRHLDQQDNIKLIFEF
jgi:hypothetical protein